MKFVLALMFFMTTQSFAFEVCSLNDTTEFDQMTERGEITLVKQTEGQSYWPVEKDMIFEAMKLESWRNIRNRDQAVFQFGDFYGDDSQPGPGAGIIQYYQIGTKTIVLVRYWRHDEYGAIFEMPTKQAFKMLAQIYDSEIHCLKK